VEPKLPTKYTKTAIFAVLAIMIMPWQSSGVPGHEQEHRRGEILVKFKDGTVENRKVQSRHRVRARRYRKFKNIGVERMLLSEGLNAQQALELLVQDPQVEFAELNLKVEYFGMPVETPDDPGFTSGDQWYLDAPSFPGFSITPGDQVNVDVDMDAPAAWGVMSLILDSSMTVAVGVLDSGCGEAGYFSYGTGYIPGHADLPNSALFSNTAELVNPGSDSPEDKNDLVDDVNGWDWIENDNIPADPYKDPPHHGTRISGIIAARWDNATDVAGIGREYLKVLPLRTSDVGEALEAIDYGIEMTEADTPVKVLNASWGIRSESRSLETAIQIAGEAGISFVAAAGNRGRDNDDRLFVVYPAEYTKVPLPNVLAVAATGTDGTLTETSNYGQVSVQIAAPGLSIHSTAGGTGGYSAADGTSFSAPMAAAALGLIAAANPGMRPEQAIERLLNGGDYDERLDGLVSSGKRLNLSGALAPFYPYSGLVPLNSPAHSLFMYTDPISAAFGTATGALSSNEAVAIMATDSSGVWAVSPLSPGVASFTVSFGGAAAPLGSYETGPWRVTAISPFFFRVQPGETYPEPFQSLVPGSDISWSVADPEIGTITEDGWFTGLKKGTTRVILLVDGKTVDSSGPIQVRSLFNSESELEGKGGCFIATAAFGSPMEPHVEILKELRDRYLLTNTTGRLFVDQYYRHSPSAAAFIKKNSFVKPLIRMLLFPLVALSYLMVHLGPLPAFLLTVVVFWTAASFLITRRSRRQGKSRV